MTFHMRRTHCVCKSLEDHFHHYASHRAGPSSRSFSRLCSGDDGSANDNEHRDWEPAEVSPHVV